MALAPEAGTEAASFAERLDSVEKALMNIVALSAKELEAQNHRLDLLQWSLDQRQRPADAAERAPALAAPAALAAPGADSGALAALGGRVGALEQSLDSLSSTLELEFTIMRHFMSGGQQRAATPGSDAGPNGALRSPAGQTSPPPARQDSLEARCDALQSALNALSHRHGAEVETARAAVAALEVASGKTVAQVGRLEASLMRLADQRANDMAAVGTHQSLLVKRVDRLESLAASELPASGPQPEAAVPKQGGTNGRPSPDQPEARVSISVFPPGETAGRMVHGSLAQDCDRGIVSGGS